jgi:DNA polymerase/3'-5' exonuclease PolX
MNLETAISYSNRIAYLLQPHCTRLHVAGSIRRQRSEVGDIEIVCEPKKIFNQTDLFGGGEWTITHGFENTIPVFMKELIKGHLGGRYMQMWVKTIGELDIKLDLFMPEPKDYFRILAIRTGSKDYASLVIAHAWKRLGWVGAGEDGLCRIEDCINVSVDEKPKWKLINKKGEKPPVWQSEEEFFEWVGLKWIPPSYREINHSINEKL